MTEPNELPKWERKYRNYHKALSRLAEIVNTAKKRELNDFERDGLIQRFEFTHECAWKLMKSYAEYKDIQGIGGSKDATRYAVDLDLVENGNIWMQMIKSRNETSHNYNGDVADDVIENILNLFFPEMVKLDAKFEKLSKVTPNSLFNS